MEERRKEDIEELKKKLRSYNEEDIEFNEPHFSQQLMLREGNREDVINRILFPDSLVYISKDRGKYGDLIYSLHFEVSNNRTLRIPVIFDRNNKKSIYIITYIMRYRHWKHMVVKNKRR